LLGKTVVSEFSVFFWRGATALLPILALKINPHWLELRWLIEQLVDHFFVFGTKDQSAPGCAALICWAGGLGLRLYLF